MINEEDLKQQIKEDKEKAWSMGLEKDEEKFNEWMTEKWSLPHAVKLNTLFYDAQNNTQTLTEFTQTCSAFSKINIDKNKGKNLGLRKETKQKIVELIKSTDRSLPLGVDIQGSSVMMSRPIGFGNSKEEKSKNKQFIKSQQKTYRAISLGATNLMKYFLDIANSKDKLIQIELKTLIFHGLYDTLKGFNNGICHQQICKALNDKLTQIHEMQF